jgi:hypothetical protein
MYVSVVKALNTDILQIMISFVYGIVLGPWNDPIYFILWLLVLELIYLFVFTVHPVVQLGIVSAYILGWLLGRQLMIYYENDPFKYDGGIWRDSEYNYNDNIDRVVSMFGAVLQ